MKVRRERMRKLAAEGFINATDCADYLVGKGMAFRDAYQVTGMIIRFCVESGKTLETMTMDDYHQFDESFADDIYAAISLERCVEGRSVIGGPAPKEVARQIESATAQLEAFGF